MSKRIFYCIRHIESGLICEYDSGYCYMAYHTKPLAQADMNRLFKPSERAAYQIDVLPDNIPPAPESVANMMIANELESFIYADGKMLIADIDGISMYKPDGELMSRVTDETFKDAGETQQKLMRVIQLPDAGKTGRVVKVCFNVDYNEYVCKLYVHGGRYKPADYFTNCKVDAFGTAKLMCAEGA